MLEKRRLGIKVGDRQIEVDICLDNEEHGSCDASSPSVEHIRRHI